jgi:RHS repeat-associated protein
VFNIFGNGLIGKVVTGAYDNLYLTNTILEGNYEAVNSITTENDVTVTGTATLKAGNTISLKPGFHAANGSNFNAKIGTVSTDLERYYYIKDHLGSIRVTTNESGTVVSAQDYFAYGELLREFNSIERYKFTEKERDTETEYDYFGARYYDSELGRWLTVDPMVDSYPEWSPYSYAGTNPLNAIDINGMEWVYIFVPGYGYMWVWQLPEVTVTPPWWEEGINERFDRFNAENSSVNEYAPYAPLITLRIVIPAFATLSTSILGMLFLSSDTDPHQRQLLMSEETNPDESETKENSKENESASEKTAKDIANQIERDLGKEARREFHDMKQGKRDRTLKELKEDADWLYKQAGKQTPNWIKPK